MRCAALLSAALTLLALALTALPSIAQTQLPAHVVAGGGGTAGSGTTWVKLTIGQPALGKNIEGTKGAELGFWHSLFGLTPTSIPVWIPPFADRLYQNVPNPIIGSTTLRFCIAREEHVQLDLFDPNGRLVTQLVNEVLPAGEHSMDYRPEDLSGGVYLLRLQAGAFCASRHLVLLR